MKLKSSLRNFLALAGSSLFTITSASAQTDYYWDSNSTTAGFGNTAGTWGTSTFWGTSSAGTGATANTTITSVDTVNFGTATLNYGTSNIGVAAGGVTTGSIVMGAGQTTAINLGTAGNAITIHSGITKNAGSGALTLVSPITLGAAQSWTNNSASAININSTVAMNGNLTIDGTGVTVINNTAAVFSGTGDLIKNGSGNLNHGGATPAHTFTGNVIVNGGNISSQSQSWLTGRNVQLTNGYIGGRFGSGFTWTGGLGTGANQIQITGGTSGLSGEGNTGSTFQIGTALSTLKWGAAGENGATGFFNPTVFLANGNANMNTNGKGSLNNGIDLNGTTRTITSTQTTNGANNSGFTISGVISNSIGTAGLTMTGVGNLILSGANTYNGGTTINGGSITLNNTSALGTVLANRNLTFTGNGRLNSNVTSSLNVLTVNPGVTASFSNQNTTFTSTTGSGNITYLGSNNANGLINLGDASAFTGNLRNDIGGTGNFPTKTIQFSSLSDTVGSKMQFGGGDGNGSQSSRYLFTGASAPLIMTNRQVEFFAKPATGSSFDRAILQNDNTDAANKWVISQNLANTTDRAHKLELRGTNTGANEFAGALIDSTNGTGNTLSLIKVNAGNWSLSNANNTFTGSITLGQNISGSDTRGSNNGTLSYASAGGANPITFSLTTGSATLAYIGTGQTMSGAITANTVTTGTVTLDASGSGAINYSNTASLGAAASGNKNLVLSGTNTGNNILAGQWVDNTGGAATLTKNGAGTWNLSGTNTYTGATTVNAGTLAIGGAGSINSTSAINVAAGANFVYNSTTALTVAPTLNGSGSNKATFSGSGMINAAMTLNSIDDVLSPGNSPGVQAFGTNQTWSSFTYEWELNDWASSVAGTNIDQIQITGALSLDGAAYALNILSLDSLDDSGFVGDGGGNTFAETDKSWTILTTSGGITGFDSLEWTINAAGFLDIEGGTWGLSQSGNNLVLSYTSAAIPEPGAALLGSLGILLIFRRRR